MKISTCTYGTGIENIRELIKYLAFEITTFGLPLPFGFTVAFCYIKTK